MTEPEGWLDNYVLAIVVSATIIAVGLWFILP
jgi:hypothetical protein